MNACRALMAWLCCGAALLAQAASRPEPSTAAVASAARGGWTASLIHESDVGVWTCGVVKCLPGTGAPEVFALDDKGRCTILVGYSGKWTPLQTVEDREWLGTLASVDLDPRRPGAEIYVSGKRGNIYQIYAHRDGGFDCNLVARVPGHEIHTLVGGDLLPERPGAELVAFTMTGDVHEVRPTADPWPGFEARRFAAVPGRARDAVVLPPRAGGAPRIAICCRSGEVLILRMTPGGFEHELVAKEAEGLGRIARLESTDGGDVLYVTRDDGLVLRLAAAAIGGPWVREVIYAGPQGPRGLASGRFFADPGVTESIAVFGYGREVHLLRRGADGAWTPETIYVDKDMGHWLAAVELDGRNGAHELVGAGYSGRVVMLSRPPGYGLPGVPVAPAAESRPVRDGR